jgi:hypothetical protein
MLLLTFDGVLQFEGVEQFEGIEQLDGDEQSAIAEFGQIILLGSPKIFLYLAIVSILMASV